MSALFVPQDEINRRLSSFKNLHRGGVIHQGTGRKTPEAREPRGPNLTDDQRSTIGALSKIIGPNAAATVLGVSQTQAMNASTGTTSRVMPVKEELRKSIAQKTGKIEDIATDAILQVITDLDVSDLKPKEAVSVAKDLSAIIKNVRPDQPMSLNGAVVVFTPKLREISEFAEMVTDAEIMR